MYGWNPSVRLDEPGNARTGGASLQEETVMKKEREAKDDGRYIIFYTFETEEPPDEDGED